MQQRNNEIVYTEGFLNPQPPELDPEPVALDEQPDSKPDHRPFPVLLTAQLVVCIVIALTVFLLSVIHSPLYDTFCAWYEDQMRRTLISDDVFEAADLSTMFSPATADEVPTQGD